MEELAPLFNMNVFGYELEVTLSLFSQWVVIFIALILSVLYSRSVKKNPGKVQTVMEMGVEFLSKIVEENIGPGTQQFVPYIGSLAIYLFMLNMTGLFGIKPATSNFSVALGFAIISFVVIQTYAIKKEGIGGYLKGFVSPVAFLLPINLMERIMLPISLALRLFGNIFAATIIMELIYSITDFSLILGIGIPIPFHAYFDIFDGTLQMIIFVMITMIQIRITSEE